MTRSISSTHLPDHVSLPMAAFDGSVIRMTKGKDAEAQSAVERCSDRRQIARPKGDAA